MEEKKRFVTWTVLRKRNVFEGDFLVEEIIILAVQKHEPG